MSRNLVLSSVLSVVLTAAIPAFSQAQAADVAPAASAQVSEGVMVYSADGRKVGAVYRAFEDGKVGVILGSKMVVLPAATISQDGDRVQTSLSYREVMKLR